MLLCRSLRGFKLWVMLHGIDQTRFLCSFLMFIIAQLDTYGGSSMMELGMFAPL